jgi:hypothetical protein
LTAEVQDAETSEEEKKGEEMRPGENREEEGRRRRVGRRKRQEPLAEAGRNRNGRRSGCSGARREGDARQAGLL